MSASLCPSRLMRRAGMLLLALLSAFFAPAAAEAQTPFYQGKQLAIVINYPQGGPTDTEGRLMARHLGKHIPGNPTVIVKNMPGEGGDLGAAWMARTAAPDGLTLGYFTGTASRAALVNPELAADVARLAFIASTPGISVTYARTDIGGGMKKASDILTKRDFWVGGLTADSDRDLRTRLQLDLLDIKHRYVTGYPGTADARLAFQRGDIQVFMESLASYRQAIEPGIVANGTSIPLWFDPIDDGESFSRSTETDGIVALTFTDFLLKARGELPKSEQFAAWRLVNRVGTQFLRILAMAPDTPKEAVAAVTLAVEKLAQDNEFREDSLKSLKFVLQHVTGERVAPQFRALLAPDPRLRSYIREYIARAGAGAPRKQAQ